MKIISTKIKDCFIIEPEFICDNRGFFTRTFCKEEFRKYGLLDEFVQESVAYNNKPYIMRGMHFQKYPYEEVKLVRVARGLIYDVILDLRSGSETFLNWISVELSSEKRNQVYVPKGCAHGYQSLSKFSEVCYKMTTPFKTDYYAGVRYNDPLFGIEWPEYNKMVISDKDKMFTNYQPLGGGGGNDYALKKYLYFLFRVSILALSCIKNIVVFIIQPINRFTFQEYV